MSLGHWERGKVFKGRLVVDICFVLFNNILWNMYTIVYSCETRINTISTWVVYGELTVQSILSFAESDNDPFAVSSG